VLATVESLACPELGVWSALQDVAGLNKGFTEAKLIVTGAPGEIGIVGRVRGVGFTITSVFIHALSELCSGFSQLLTKINSA